MSAFSAGNLAFANFSRNFPLFFIFYQFQSFFDKNTFVLTFNIFYGYFLLQFGLDGVKNHNILK